jgi:aspartyl-tRNA(Asn)/glutamyl-tRNA(Gln) amidotransferase subunit C
MRGLRRLHDTAACDSPTRTSMEMGRDMAVGEADVKRIARLARLAVEPEQRAHLAGEINAILGFVEQLSEVDVSSVEAMTSVTPMAMKKRADMVDDGDDAERVLANAPAREDGYFVVPKVIE